MMLKFPCRRAMYGRAMAYDFDVNWIRIGGRIPSRSGDDVNGTAHDDAANKYALTAHTGRGTVSVADGSVPVALEFNYFALSSSYGPSDPQV